VTQISVSIRKFTNLGTLPNQLGYNSSADLVVQNNRNTISQAKKCYMMPAAEMSIMLTVVYVPYF
jgi:hypothetical protein